MTHLKPILTGQRVRLRPITIDDAPAMMNALQDEESNRLTGTRDTFTFEQVERFCGRLFEADDRTDYAITLIDDADMTYVGEVVLNDIDSDNRSANFRIALAGPEYFGRGLGSEATELMLRYGFETLALHRIELEVFAFNPRAIHVYEKAGFKREGVRRDALLWEGEYVDSIIMSQLADEFKKRSPNND